MQTPTRPATEPVFGPTVEPHHDRIDADPYEDVYVVGDVHGCITELEDLVGALGGDGDALFVLVGDLVRKGPDSSAVLAFVREHDNVVAVRGNNEQKLIDGRADCEGLSERDRAQIESLPVAISWAGNLVVHGGVDPRKPLAEHTVSDLLTMREIDPDADPDRPYWFDHYRDQPRVFFGHTVLEAPFETRWAVGLDTGCVYGGRLTAYHCETGRCVTLDARRTYQFRAPEKFIPPGRTPDAERTAVSPAQPGD